ncbi:hypothetical protein EB233_05630 [Mesorhizobium erdmanii]|uniref:Propionyl-coenzyme A carboxylase alpha polypeptide n=1 Tax=Mesorhizobium erdmanii TaxID=1777866 RepID=A0A6M7UG58_9HYPH|nr:hypothetical protein EB233_05630 [Mesorhizobium erdmanii]
MWFRRLCPTRNVGGTAPPSALPGISPTWGEIGRHDGFRQSSALERGRRARRCQSPPNGEMSGRTEGGAVERWRSPFAPPLLNA